jgi:hypothetical protein
MNGFWKKSHMARLAAVSLAAVMAFGATTAVRAQEEGEFAKNILGKMGLIPEDRDPIEYRERAPLVLPPKADLPMPADSNLGERKTANWPKDPDVAAARERAAEARKPRTQTKEYLANQRDGRLSPNELRGRTAGRDPNDRTPVNAPDNKLRASGWMHPDDLRATGKTFKDGTNPGEEPSRSLLTDPPVGYRKAAGGGTIKPSYSVPDTMDPASPYYVEHQKRKAREEDGY